MVTFALGRTRPSTCFFFISKRPLFEGHIYVVGSINLRNITMTGLAESLIFGPLGRRCDSVFSLAIFSGEYTQRLESVFHYL